MRARRYLGGTTRFLLLRSRSAAKLLRSLRSICIRTGSFDGSWSGGVAAAAVALPLVSPSTNGGVAVAVAVEVAFARTAAHAAYGGRALPIRMTASAFSKPSEGVYKQTSPPPPPDCCCSPLVEE